jgi:hypothetical protein
MHNYKGKSSQHPFIFTLKGAAIRTIRDGKWIHFLTKADFYCEFDLKTGIDKRAPDIVTIIAPAEQVTPAHYRGIIPVMTVGEMLLLNLENDPAESNNLSGSYAKIKESMIREYKCFLHSLTKPEPQN